MGHTPPPGQQASLASSVGVTSSKTQSVLCKCSVSRTSFLGERDVRTPLVIPAIWAFRDDGGENSVYKGKKEKEEKGIS